MTYNFALKSFNTFSINVFAKYILSFHNENELINLLKKIDLKKTRILILGSGSNVLFLENYNGIILLNRIKGITIREDKKYWYLHVGAGEIWHELVKYSLKKNIHGLENLAMIPGHVGSASIQNIGAYGVELQQLCEYVEILQIKNFKKKYISNVECKFNYRESIFKNKLRDKCIVLAVGLRLYKNWQPILNHKYLKIFNSKSVKPHQIFNTICNIRNNTLPDINMNGNAGSFFKNPIIKLKTAHKLINYYPDMPYYIQTNGRIKLAAGWLIEHCHLKGYKLGKAAIYEKQALILISQGKQATSIEILLLARYICRQVLKKFAVWLEPEVRFIASNGEINALRILYWKI